MRAGLLNHPPSPPEQDALGQAMARLSVGERAALAEVYRLTSAKLYAICLRILKDRAEAEDALQDVYVSLWRRADRFDPTRASARSWLAVFARNRAIDRLRANRVGRGAAPVDLAERIADEAPDPEAAALASSDAAQVHKCLAALEERQQDAIRTAFLEGVTYAELADRRDVPLGTMKSWIRRGLARLKACLEQ